MGPRGSFERSDGKIRSIPKPHSGPSPSPRASPSANALDVRNFQENQLRNQLAYAISFVEFSRRRAR